MLSPVLDVFRLRQSYCGDVYFGITGDWDGAPDIDTVVSGIDLAFEAMGKRAAAAAGDGEIGRQPC